MEQKVLDFLIQNWQYVLVGFFIILGFVINILDRKFETKHAFSFEEMPIMQPISIPTKGKGFWSAIWIWLFTTRNWTITKDFYFTLDDAKFVIPKGFVFDGASVPKIFRSWLSPTGVLLIGGLVHDFGYKYKTLVEQSKTVALSEKDQKWMDKVFRDININVNGFRTLNYLAYYALRLGGFIAWNGHRKRNLNWKDNELFK